MIMGRETIRGRLSRGLDSLWFQRASPTKAVNPIGPAPEDGDAPGAELKPEDARLRGWRSAAFWIAAVACTGLILVAYGFVPDSSQVPLMALHSTGMLTCLHNQGVSSLWTWCMATGVPIGAPALTGLPQLYVGWALTFIPGVSPWVANQITGVLLVVLGVAGLFLLLRRWSVPRWLALLAVLSYFLGPNLLQLNGFAHTFDGFILLPAYLYAALRILDQMDHGRWLRAVIGAVLLSLLIAFTDGYSYFAAAVAIGCLTLGSAVRSWLQSRRVTSIASVAAWLTALGAAALTYAMWAPASTFTNKAPLDFFAQFGVDVASLFVPSDRFLSPRLVGLTPPELPVWGADAALPTNYLGYLTGAFAVLAVVVVIRQRWDVRWEVLGLAVAALITFVFALGPTVKFAQYEPGVDASLLTLPTSWLYENVPGFTSLRASNRWLVATRLCLVLLSTVGLTALWRSWGRRSTPRAVAVVMIALVTLVEVLPEPAYIVTERRRSIERVRYLENGIVAEADRLLRDDELILMLPSVNDFLADFLVPVVGVRSYNVGIDKNHALASAAWPAAVRAANESYGPDSGDQICAVLRTDADAVVLPSMDTRTGPLLHSNKRAIEAERRAWALQHATDTRFDAEVGDWLVVLRPAAGGDCAPAG